MALSVDQYHSRQTNSIHRLINGMFGESMAFSATLLAFLSISWYFLAFQSQLFLCFFISWHGTLEHPGNQRSSTDPMSRYVRLPLSNQLLIPTKIGAL